jgi:hypothetical protein
VLPEEEGGAVEWEPGQVGQHGWAEQWLRRVGSGDVHRAGVTRSFRGQDGVES